ncbi:integrase [Mycobacterium intracellulare]|uniref:integrase n=1 Tax=Mycobacterium intracellulare TaxID=1767 RepID=UPI001EEE3198|nr:integrase [Mycobacterium intracellulare]MEE3752452.1 integrase [Mycobacterium intracellulare]
MRIRRIAGTTAAAGMLAAAMLTVSTPTHVARAAVGQHPCGANALCPNAPAPDGGDQAAAERAIIDGYVKKQVGCTPTMPPNPVSIAWDPPGFTPGVGGSGLIHDANPALGGQYRADYVDGRWRIEYLYC